MPDHHIRIIMFLAKESFNDIFEFWEGVNMSLKEAPGIIPAVDMPLGNALVYLDKLKELEDEVTGPKIGGEVIDECGFLTTMRLLDQIGYSTPVILDMQKRGNDVPEFIRRQIKLASDYGISAYIGHPLGSGSEGTLTGEKIGSLQAFVKYCREEEIEPIIVLEMTQPGATYFLKDGAPEELAEISTELGVKYFVGPANKPGRLKEFRKIIADDAEIISPGVGPQKTGDPIKDAVNAVYAGADHLVIGRALYQSENPIETAKSIYEAVEKAHRIRNAEC